MYRDGAEFGRGHPSDPLGFDNLPLQGLHESDHLAPLSRRDLKRVQGGSDMTHKRRPIGVSNLHPLIGRLHVSTRVTHEAAGARTENINQELLLAPDAVLSSVLPEPFQPRTRH